MRIKVKICGLSSAEAVDAAVTGGASHVGFIITRSPRRGEVSVEQAALLATRVPPQVGRIAVVRDLDSVEFAAAVAQAKVQAFQFFASHPPQPYWGASGGPTYGRAIWATAPIRTEGNLRAVAAWRGRFDRVVYDLGDDVGLPGCDWSWLARREHPAPWALRGAIDAENVGELIAATGAPMLDVVCACDGVADPRRIATLLDAVNALPPSLIGAIHAKRATLPPPLPARSR